MRRVAGRAPGDGGRDRIEADVSAAGGGVEHVGQRSREAPDAAADVEDVTVGAQPAVGTGQAEQLGAGGQEVAVARKAAQPPGREEPVGAPEGAIAEVERPQAQGGQPAGEHGREHRRVNTARVRGARAPG